MSKDLREFLTQVKKSKELTTIKKKVSIKYEIRYKYCSVRVKV